MFARHGIPERLILDNGPQFITTDLARFADQYGFTHITTSSKYPHANGVIEHTVQTVKNMLKKTREPQRALLAYRSTPLEHRFSPAELVMGGGASAQCTSPSQLVPSWPYLDQFRETDEHLKSRQTRNFDIQHRARDLPDSNPETMCGSQTTRLLKGTVLEKTPTPISYIVDTQQ